MTFVDPTPAPSALASPVVKVAASPIERDRRDGIRAALDAGRPPRPELASVAALLRVMRARGCTPEDVESVRSLEGLDATEFAAVRDHAWGVGAVTAPPPAAPLAVIAPIDLDDLFGGSPQVADVCRLASTVAMCSPDLPALACVALMSAAIAQKAVGAAHDPRGNHWWTNPPCEFVVVEVPSGGGKTLVRNLLQGAHLTRRGDAVRVWHEELAAAEGGKRERLDARKQIATRELARLTQAGNDPERAAEIGKEIAGLKEELAKPAPRSPDWLQWGTISPEHYVRQARLGGYMALFPDEGKDALSKFLGDASGRADALGPLLSAFSGEAYTHQTISGEVRGDAARFERFRCTMFLPIQPGVLSPATAADGQMLSRLASRGLLGRLLIARPRISTAQERPSLRAQSAGDPKEVERVKKAWTALLDSVLHADGQESGDLPGDPKRAAEEALVGRPHPLVPARPWVFTYEPAAADALFAFQARTQDSAAPGGQYERPGIAEFVSRLGDHAHRLATLLAIMRTGGIAGGGVVTADDVGRATRFLEAYALPHAEGVHNRAIFDPIDDDAAVVLAKLRQVGEITMRDLARRLGNSGRGWGKQRPQDKETRLATAVSALVSQGRVVVEQAGRGSVLVRVVGEGAGV